MTILVPKKFKNLDEFTVDSQVLEPFSDILVSFVTSLSKEIFKDSLCKNYPELIALAFWMRKSHVEEIKSYFFEQKKDKIWIARGVSFHIAPSNVDTIFVYSFFLSLLVGNSNIVRISSKNTPQVDLLILHISKLLEEEKFSVLENRIVLLQYGHKEEINRQLSLMADVRVVWGGDETIKYFRSLPIKPSAIELTFADKFSFSIIDASQSDFTPMIEKFYNDSFWFSQMACSSIRLIVWVGKLDEVKKAKESFWNLLSLYVDNHIPKEIEGSDMVNKFVSQCLMAIESRDIDIKNQNTFLSRVEIDSFDDVKEELHSGMGLFYEIDIQKLDELVPFVTKKHQTLSYFGFTKTQLREWVTTHRPQGIDRIVPIGSSLEFSNVWDGYDMLRSFCREVEIV